MSKIHPISMTLLSLGSPSIGGIGMLALRRYVRSKVFCRRQIGIRFCGLVELVGGVKGQPRRWARVLEQRTGHGSNKRTM